MKLLTICVLMSTALVVATNEPPFINPRGSIRLLRLKDEPSSRGDDSETVGPEDTPSDTVGPDETPSCQSEDTDCGNGGDTRTPPCDSEDSGDCGGPTTTTEETTTTTTEETTTEETTTTTTEGPTTEETTTDETTTTKEETTTTTDGPTTTDSPEESETSEDEPTGREAFEELALGYDEGNGVVTFEYVLKDTKTMLNITYSDDQVKRDGDVVTYGSDCEDAPGDLELPVFIEFLEDEVTWGDNEIIDANFTWFDTCGEEGTQGGRKLQKFLRGGRKLRGSGRTKGYIVRKG